MSYTYDGDGERVAKSSGTLYWTGTGSDPLDESDAAGNITEEYVFFNGKRIARLDTPTQPNPAIHFYFSDHLGSASVITDALGATIEEESDYYPFGGERVVTAGPNPFKFTGKERDSETNFDYFGARYYASSLGRWLTPDWAGAPTAVPYASFPDPQTLNLYTYVRNSPITQADLDGHQCLGCPIMLQLPNTLDAAKDLAVASENTFNDVGIAFVTLVFSPDEAVKGTAKSIGTAVQAYGTSAGRAELANALGNDPSFTRQIVFESFMLGGIVVASGASRNATPVQTLGLGAQDAATALASRALQIHQQLDPIAQNMRTTAVAARADGGTVVATSSRTTLTPSQRSALVAGESIARGPASMHAEAKILSATEPGSLTALATTRQPCPGCAGALAAAKISVKVAGTK